MSTGSIGKQLILFSLPLVAANLIQTFGQTADIAIAGRYIGADGISAIYIGSLVYTFLTAGALGFSFGGAILCAQLVGRKAYGKLAKTIKTLFFLAMVLSAVLGLLAFLFQNVVLEVLNTPEVAFAQALRYLSVCCLTLLFFTFNNLLYGIFRGLGNSRLPLLLTLVQAGLEAALNYYMVGSLQMDVIGTAYAMLVSQGLAAILGSFIFLKKYGWIFWKTESVDAGWKNICASIWKVSLPILLFGIVMAVSTAFINSNINLYGVSASAADGVGHQLQNIVSAIFTGIYEGAAVMVGHSFGKEDHSRIRRIFIRTILTGLAVSVIVLALFLLWPSRIFRLFSSDPQVLAYTRGYLLIMAVQFVGLALSTGPFALFEGVGNTKLEALSGILDNLVVRILAGILLGRIWGVYGYWIGCAMGAFVMPVVGFIYYKSNRWKKLC